MNRVEKRNLIRNFNHKKGLQKKKTKGAFGVLPEYIKESKKKEAKKLKPVDTKEVTTKKTQPIENKVVKEKGNE